MDMKDNAEYIIPSPKELNTFVLDLPAIKDSQKLNAVKFELMSVFPGNIDEASVDYHSNRNNTLAFVASQDLKQKYGQKTLISPLLLSQLMFENGVILFIYSSCFELIRIENKEVKEIQRYSSKFDFKLMQRIEELQAEKDLLHIEYYSCRVEETSGKEALDDFLLRHGFKNISINGMMSGKKIKEASLYEPKKNGSSPLFFYIPTFIMMIAFAITGSLYSKKAARLSDRLQETKKTYEVLKAEAAAISSNTSSIAETVTTIYPEKYSVQQLFTILSRYPSYLKITNLSIADNTFRIEGTCRDSLKLTSYLDNIETLSEIVLHQTVNTDEGVQKFSISGRIQND